MSSQPPRHGLRMTFARACAMLASLALLIALHAMTVGGFVIEDAGLRVSARSPRPPLTGALVLSFVAVLAAGRRGVRPLAAWLGNPSTSAPVFAMALAGATVATGLAAGVRVAGSADASGYVAEARLIAAGRLFRDEPLSQSTFPPLGGEVVSPLGFRPAPELGPTSQVPTYAPGLPLLMALAERIAGRRGPFLVVPIAGGLAVWLAFALGRRLGHPGAGLTAAMLLASTPVFLFQLLQPMSDVPVTAAWLASVVSALRGRAVASGAAAGLAMLIRPNLLPLGLPVLALAALTQDTRGWRALRWVAAAGPGVIVAAVLHTLWYGAPWRSGYGTVSELYGVANVGPNAVLYSTWLLESAPALLPALVAALAAVARGGIVARVVAAALALNIALYLPYATFEHWHYLRFLLPGLALAVPMGMAFIASRLESRPPLQYALAALALSLSVGQLRDAESREVFRLRAIERRYAIAADWVARETPPTAVIATAQQSGSIALNAGRSVLRWDLIEPGSLDHAIRGVEASGRPVWLLVERWERPALAARHRGDLAGLDWPPAAAITAAVPVDIYAAADRARFLAGSRILTAYIADNQRSRY